jgi:UDP-3-O-[3-hydroxymyristoyl] N-acetylglucosamine deacetylase
MARGLRKVQYEIVSQLQKTLKTEVKTAGIGLHTGKPANMAIKAAPVDTGYVFIRTDIEPSQNRILAHSRNVTATQLGTSIANEYNISVATIEHILAALFGLGIDNAFIEIDGPEVPILDGSSDHFVEILAKAGIISQTAPRKVIEILQPIEVRDGVKYARLLPADSFILEVDIHFTSKIIGHQSGVYDIGKGEFATKLAKARTFGFLHQVETMRKNGLSLGGSLDNAIVIDGDNIMNDSGLRYDDEFVRHKALDAVGDLSLAGAAICGRYVAHQSGHALNVALVKELFANPNAWRMRVSQINANSLAAAGI